MTDLLVFPDSEQITADFLRAALAAESGFTDVQVAIRLPDTLAARFVQIRRAGGVRDSLVADNPRIQYTAWGATQNSDTDAHDICQLVRGLLLSRMRGTVIDGTPIYNVTEFGGPVPIPDPDTGRSRYLASVSIRLRGATHA